MTPAPTEPGALIVFSDDWGRHPSSAQHLVARLPGHYPIVWVNTIGTRGLRLDRATFDRVLGKLRQWVGGGVSAPGPAAAAAVAAEATAANAGPGAALAGRLRVLAPRMWPGFGRPWMRALNARMMAACLDEVLPTLPRPVVVLTTLPIVADLPGRLPGLRWMYYCVDDFSVWPGYDGATMARMEADLVAHLDGACAVSETLVGHLARFGLEAPLLTHGVDTAFWREGAAQAVPELPRDEPVVCFWGVVDRRLDIGFLQALSARLAGRARIVLIGPREDPDPALDDVAGVTVLPAMPMARLPAVAAASRVLIMPYADLPVTRAMQPLKLKEYLATDRPVVVRALPSTLAWKEACDVCARADDFAARVLERLDDELAPPAQREARSALESESWQAKAAWLGPWLCDTRSRRS